MASVSSCSVEAGAVMEVGSGGGDVEWTMAFCNDSWAASAYEPIVIGWGNDKSDRKISFGFCSFRVTLRS